MRDLSQVSGAGFQLVALVLVFTGIGYGLDRLFDTVPWLMIGGVFVGAGLGFWTFIRTVISADKDGRRKNGGPPGPGGNGEG